MALRTFITLFLGLAFQLAQVLPGGGVPTTPPAKACECCAGSNSCGCAKRDMPAPKPAPQPLPAPGLLKGMAMKTAETRVFAEVLHDDLASSAPAAGQATAPHAGFAGVRLAVAYCSFVI